MSAEQASVVVILALAVIGFIWGRWRHDVVALGALLAAGLPAGRAAAAGRKRR